MTTPDYYAVLGVEPAADLQQIKSAYRRRAMQCHPDRGGSHEQMLQLNEAFQVLANSQSRRQYDQARANASAAWSGTPPQADAQAKAGDYPRQWSEFDGWLDAIGADFAKAEYGIAGEGMLKIPTAGPSVSGWLFILGCAAGGAWLAYNGTESISLLPTSAGYTSGLP